MHLSIGSIKTARDLSLGHQVTLVQVVKVTPLQAEGCHPNLTIHPFVLEVCQLVLEDRLRVPSALRLGSDTEAYPLTPPADLLIDAEMSFVRDHALGEEWTEEGTLQAVEAMVLRLGKSTAAHGDFTIRSSQALCL